MLSHFSHVQLFVSLPGSSDHGILQERILEWVAMPWDDPDPGIEPGSPALQADSLLLSHQGSPDDRLNKEITDPQTPQNILLDVALPFRETKSSSTHQNANASLPNQEAFIRHLSEPTNWEQTPQVGGTTTWKPVERRPQTQ